MPWTGPKGAKLLVYEYVPNGSLLEYIMGKLKGMHCYMLTFLNMFILVDFIYYYHVGKRGRSLTWRQRVNIAIGTAKGAVLIRLKWS